MPVHCAWLPCCIVWVLAISVCLCVHSRELRNLSTIHNRLICMYVCVYVCTDSIHVLLYGIIIYVCIVYVSVVSVFSILYVSCMFLYLSILACSVTREASEVRHLSCFPKVVCCL